MRSQFSPSQLYGIRWPLFVSFNLELLLHFGYEFNHNNNKKIQFGPIQMRTFTNIIFRKWPSRSIALSLSIKCCHRRNIHFNRMKNICNLLWCRRRRHRCSSISVNNSHSLIVCQSSLGRTQRKMKNCTTKHKSNKHFKRRLPATDCVRRKKLTVFRPQPQISLLHAKHNTIANEMNIDSISGLFHYWV